MAWTPYVGDPANRLGDLNPPHLDAPNDYLPGSGFSRRVGMTSGQVMTTSTDGGRGANLFTPDQTWFRRNILSGRWGGFLPTAPAETADRSVNMIRRHPDGTCDLVSLEACGNFHLDLGGRGARDVRAGRPL